MISGNATANFTYDGDGKQIKATVNGITAVYVGNHYEVKDSVVTKYYFAGTTRLAVRTNGTLKYLLSDHLGSTTLSTDANGTVSASALYKAFGELRSTPSALGTDYKFTGQREEASLGLYFFVARWFDPSLGRFTSPDSIVPTGTQGTQAWDRYAFVNNNPVRYNDPTGHDTECGIGETCPEDEAQSGSSGTGVFTEEELEQMGIDCGNTVPQTVCDVYTKGSEIDDTRISVDFTNDFVGNEIAKLLCSMIGQGCVNSNVSYSGVFLYFPGSDGGVNWYRYAVDPSGNMSPLFKANWDVAQFNGTSVARETFPLAGGDLGNGSVYLAPSAQNGSLIWKTVGMAYEKSGITVSIGTPNLIQFETRSSFNFFSSTGRFQFGGYPLGTINIWGGFQP